MRHKTKLLLLGIIIHAGLHAQTIEHYYDYAGKPSEPEEAISYSLVIRTDTGWYRRDYYTREKKLQMAGLYQDRDCTIPNGSFLYFYPNKQLSSSGKFAGGKKEGLWLRYHPNGMPQDSTSFYNGQPVGIQLSWHPNGYPRDSSVYRPDGSGAGISWFNNGELSAAGFFSAGRRPDRKWLYFHKNGKPSCTETYDKGKLISRQHFDESGTLLADTTDIETEATFPGGVEAWSKYLQKKLYFPTQYKFKNGQKAVVVVSFTVSEEGTVEDVYVSTSLHPDFDRIAERVITQSPKWIPARSKNRHIRSYRKQPVVFGQKYI